MSHCFRLPPSVLPIFRTTKRLGLIGSRHSQPGVTSAVSVCRIFRLAGRSFRSRIHECHGTDEGTKAYRYEPIPDSSSIRILILHPGSGEDDLEISLNCTTPTVIDYEALSYVWNNPYAQTFIGTNHCYVSIRETDQRMKVEPNLYLALRRLRRPSEPRLLWIDALCINQDDTEEKSHQILLMSSIYTSAKKTVVWLGEQDKWTEKSYEVIIRWAGIQNLERQPHQPTILRMLKASGGFEHDQLNFEALIRRAWFTRGWTFQEILLARDAEIHCGGFSISWSVFHDACSAVLNSGQASFIFEENANIKAKHYFWNFTRALPSREGTGRDERLNLDWLIQQTRSQEVTNPRDKIYCLLGIANPPRRDKSAFIPDYSSSVAEVYCKFTRAIIQETGTLAILSNVKQAYPDKALRALAAEGGIRPISGLPSWVPDYQESDCTEYIASDENIRQTSPQDQNRTRFPQPFIQQDYTQAPTYKASHRYSDGISDEITFHTDNREELGLHGLRLDRIEQIFSLKYFISDPQVKAPLSKLSYLENASVLSEDLVEEDWFHWWKFFAVDKYTHLERPLPELYMPTGEKMILAILRTCSADSLPISSRPSEMYKRTYFPRHYDWYFWRKEHKHYMPLSLMADVWELLETWKVRQRRLAQGEHNKERWVAVDRASLHDPSLLYRLYKRLLQRPGTKGDELLQMALHRWKEFKKYPLYPINIVVLLGLEAAWLALLWFSKSLSSVLLYGVTRWLGWNSKPAEFDPAIPPNMLLNIFVTMKTIPSPRAARDPKWAMAIEVVNAINRASWARVFFVTTSGFIGIGPLGTQRYDEVYTFLGGQVPYVVRQREGMAERYQLLGECYVHGFMDGELWEKQRWWKDDLDVEEMKRHLQRIILA